MRREDGMYPWQGIFIQSDKIAFHQIRGMCNNVDNITQLLTFNLPSQSWPLLAGRYNIWWEVSFIVVEVFIELSPPGSAIRSTHKLLLLVINSSGQDTNIANTHSENNL